MISDPGNKEMNIKWGIKIDDYLNWWSEKFTYNQKCLEILKESYLGNKIEELQIY